MTSAERPHSISAVTRYIIIAIALLLLTAILWIAADALVIAFGGIVFATVLRAIVRSLRQFTGWSERLSLTVAVVGLVIALGLLGWLFGSQAANQFAAMREQLPEAVDKMRAWVEQSKFGRAAIDALKDAVNGGTAKAGLAAGAIVGGIGNVLLIVFVGIYLAGDPDLYRRGALRLLPPARRSQVGRAFDDAGVALHKWLVAQIIVMAAVGILTGIGMALLGVPLSLSLGLLAGILEFVPVVGPIVSAVPGILLAFAKGPETALHATIVYILVQQIESNVLTPLVQRWAVELAPVVALLSIVVCGLLFGVLGVLFATPMAVVAIAMVQHLYVEDTLEKPKGTNASPRARA